MTFAFWMLTDNSTIYSPVLLSQPSRDPIFIQTTGDGFSNNLTVFIEYRPLTSSGIFFINGGTYPQIPSNRFSHICFTYDTNGVFTTYINGVALDGSTFGQNLNTLRSWSFDTLILGPTYNGGYYTGYLADVRLYNGALSALQVMNVFNMGTIPPALEPPPPQSSEASTLILSTGTDGFLYATGALATSNAGGPAVAETRCVYFYHNDSLTGSTTPTFVGPDWPYVEVPNPSNTTISAPNTLQGLVTVDYTTTTVRVNGLPLYQFLADNATSCSGNGDGGSGDFVTVRAATGLSGYSPVVVTPLTPRSQDTLSNGITIIYTTASPPPSSTNASPPPVQSSPPPLAQASPPPVRASPPPLVSASPQPPRPPTPPSPPPSPPSPPPKDSNPLPSWVIPVCATAGGIAIIFCIIACIMAHRHGGSGATQKTMRSKRFGRIPRMVPETAPQAFRY